jgi:hypothetical protein
MSPEHIAVQVLAQFDGREGVMVVPMTCVRDRLEHAVTDIEVEVEHRSGRGIYRSVCGHKVMPGSLASPPGRSCSACLEVLASLRLQARLAKPGPAAGRRLRAAARRALGRGSAPDGRAASGRPDMPAGGRRPPDPAASRSPALSSVGWAS